MVFASKRIQSPTERGRRLNNFHLIIVEIP
jgi:hypothetical protein